MLTACGKQTLYLVATSKVVADYCFVVRIKHRCFVCLDYYLVSLKQALLSGLNFSLIVSLVNLLHCLFVETSK